MIGTIVRWVDDRGFGFINTNEYKSDVFVHISQFARGYRRPQVGDKVVFQIELKAGKANAKSVQLIGVEPIRKVKSRSSVPSVFSLLLLGVVGFFGYKQFFTPEPLFESKSSVSSKSYSVPKIFSAPKISSVSRSYENIRFRCEGKVYCRQMRSCAEAKFYLKNCPNVKIDGDGDGIPCERQWCN